MNIMIKLPYRINVVPTYVEGEDKSFVLAIQNLQ